MKKTEEQLRKGRIASAKWYAKNKKRKAVYQRKYDLLKLYGLTEEKYHKLLKSQKNKCAVCFEPEKPDKKLHIDHSHVTGRVRGLLCARCNKALGLLLDSPILLGRLIGYLKTNDYYAKRTVEYLKTSFKVSNKVKKNNNKKQIPISRYVIKLTNDFFENFHREYEKVLKSKQKETKGTLEEFV